MEGAKQNLKYNWRWGQVFNALTKTTTRYKSIVNTSMGYTHRWRMSPRWGFFVCSITFSSLIIAPMGQGVQ